MCIKNKIDSGSGAQGVKEIIGMIRPERWEATREALAALGVEEVCHQRVLGRGHQQGLRYLRPLREGEFGGTEFLPKRMVWWLVPDDRVDAVVATLIRVNHTGNYGDGKIFVCPLEKILEPAEVGAGTEKRAERKR